MSGGVQGAGGEAWWRCMKCSATNAPQHRMCTSCKKWRDLDWACVMCGYKNFAKRDTCKECGAGHVPEFNKEGGNYDMTQEVQETGFSESGFSGQPPFQGSLDDAFQTVPDPPFQGTNALMDQLWMCGMCNTENTPKRILCFECSGHRDRVEVRNRAAESRLAGGRNNFQPLSPPNLPRFSSPHREQGRLQHHREGVGENQDWKNRRRETPPWLTMNHIREQPREGAEQGRPEDRSKDWACSSCSNRNFAKRKECNRCKKPRAEVEDKSVEYENEEVSSLKRGPDPPVRHDFKVQRRSLTPLALPHPSLLRQEDLSNDWVCGRCNINCFAKKTSCFRCGKPRSEVENREADLSRFYSPPAPSRPPQHNFSEQNLNVSGHQLRLNSSSSWNPPRHDVEKKRRKWVDEDKSNDWNCKLCKINNFAKRTSCFSCKKSRAECEEAAKEVTKDSETTESSEFLLVETE